MNQRLKILILQSRTFNPSIEKFNLWAKTQDHFDSYYVQCEDFENQKLEDLAKEKQDINSFVIPFRAPYEVERALKLFPNVKWIQVFGTGVDAYVHLFPQMKEQGITLTNLKGSSGIQLAEFAVLGALYFTKQTLDFVKSAQKKQWYPHQVNMGYLNKKKAIIIGLGGIGTEIAKKFYYGFDMEITGVKRNLDQLDEVQKQVVTKMISLEEVENHLSDADFIVFSMPKSQSQPILTKENIKKFKKQPVIINVGRGDLIVEDDLFWGLQEDYIKGAALDVWNQEPLDQNSPFYQNEKLNEKILNFCHKADNGDFVQDHRVQMIAEHIRNVQKGIFQSTVDYEKWYQLIYKKESNKESDSVILLYLDQRLIE